MFYTLHCSNWQQFEMTPAHIWHSPDACGFPQPCSLRQEFKAKQACWHPAKPGLPGCSPPWGMWSGGRQLCDGHVGTHRIAASAFSTFSSLICTQLGGASRLWGFSFQRKPHACYTCCWDCRAGAGARYLYTSGAWP